MEDKMKFINVLFFIILLVGCEKSDKNQSSPNISNDKNELDFSWVKRDKKDRWTISNYKTIEYKLIKEDLKDKYINILNENEYIIIGRNGLFNIFEEYNDYYYDDRDEVIKFNYENDFYLIVRAVNANYFTNNYYVFLTDENELFITHSSMGSKVYWIDKDAIIISLEEMPDEIYVSFSVAE
jgi:hypothetical protein